MFTSRFKVFELQGFPIYLDLSWLMVVDDSKLEGILSLKNLLKIIALKAELEDDSDYR